MTRPLPRRLREIADEILGLQPIDADPIALLDAIETAYHRERIDAANMGTALRAIIATGPECQHCEEARDGGYEDPTTPREYRPITHETTLWRLPVYLCAEHAPDRDAAYRKAESKGSGKQPDVVPHVEPEHIQIARAALEWAARDPKPRKPRA